MKRLAVTVIWILVCGAMTAPVAVGEEIQVELSDRIERLEESDDGFLDISGVIEAEFGYESTDDEDVSDLVLATVELWIDVDIVDHVTGHILLLYEEDDTEPMDMDEGFITLDGGDVFPMFLSVGKMYVPFGNFGSYFVSDPLTLELGEINQSAALVGFVGETFEISAAVFNGDIDESGEEDRVGSFAVNAVFSAPENENVGFAAGVSWISNIGDTDGLEGETPGEISNHVAGFGGFVSLSFMDTFFIEGEYLGAMDDFEPGELSFDDGESLSPQTWNLELAYAATDALELAVKYEGGNDLGDFLPEDQYGAVVAWGLYAQTCLSLEYMHGEFAGGSDVDRFTLQLAVEF